VPTYSSSSSSHHVLQVELWRGIKGDSAGGSLQLLDAGLEKTRAFFYTSPVVFFGFFWVFWVFFKFFIFYENKTNFYLSNRFFMNK
jgi:hypothetical protein